MTEDRAKHSGTADNDDMSSSPSSSPPTSSKAVDVIDLEELVKRWAVQMFDYTKSKEQARIPKEHLVFSVDWRRVRFLHHEPVFVDQTKPPAPKSQVGTTVELAFNWLALSQAAW